ncbi:MAG: methyltransferase domain-containing protein [Gammaproteobacteria bacterium]|nr:MAG: methyltransferase domain-containing protein [Gammaproteobacteria bacterium]
MKGRESGMPQEAFWASFFDADCIVSALHCAPEGNERIAEFGCGYGTFTLPVAKLTTGDVYTFDIEPDMIRYVENKAAESRLANIHAEQRDFLEDGSGLADVSIDHVMIYNLLHIEESLDLLREAHRILKPGGRLSVIHWNFDPDTPRGPPMDMRPTPEGCIELAQQAGFQVIDQPDISNCAAHHYGILFGLTQNNQQS